MKKCILYVLSLILTIITIFSGCTGVGNITKNGIKTSEGEFTVGDNVQWPGSKMGGLPAPDAKITAVVSDNATGSYTVAFSDMSNEKATEYIANLKEQGYSSIFEVNDTDGVMFSGKNSSGIMVTFVYNSEAKEGTISYVPDTSGSSEGVSKSSDNEPVSEKVTENVSLADEQSVDMTDISAWPQNFIPGVTELNGKIVYVLNQNDETVTVELEYVEKADFEDYIAALKRNGFTVDSDEIKDTVSCFYTAYDQSGNFINVYMNYDNKQATVYMEKASEE